ncbi:MAG TPA: hypothetical protein VMT89_01445 [Candidatus Acidoferrales bacterium]|nr:hypothetical protein [Candidatus Acidoferrales bacterium]
MKTTVKTVLAATAILIVGSVRAIASSGGGAPVATLQVRDAVHLAQLGARERLRERRSGNSLDVDNPNNNNDQSTSCSCTAVNCRSGFSSPGCQVTCQPPNQAQCSCGQCGGDGGGDSGNDCNCLSAD